MLIGAKANKKLADGSIPRKSRRVRTGITKKKREPYMSIRFVGTLRLPRGASTER